MCFYSKIHGMGLFGVWVYLSLICAMNVLPPLYFRFSLVFYNVNWFVGNAKYGQLHILIVVHALEDIR